MNTPAQRGEPFEPQGHRGFDQCWYPLALASELMAGEVLGREFLNGKVVLFRTQNGEPHVMSAYCRHLGADLSIGTVVGDAAGLTIQELETAARCGVKIVAVVCPFPIQFISTAQATLRS